MARRRAGPASFAWQPSAGQQGKTVPGPRRWPALLRALPLALAMSLALSLPAAFAANEADNALKAFRAGDYARAFRLARPLAQQENSTAMYLLGVMYEQGRGVARDDPSAIKWYAAAAHKTNNASAEYNLAHMYLDGRGVRKNEEKAREWLRAAAAQGHPDSIKLLAELGDKGAPAAAAPANAAQDSAAPTPPASAAAAPVTPAPAPGPGPAASSPAAPAPAVSASAAPVPAPRAEPAKAAAPVVQAAPPVAPAAPAPAGTPPVLAAYQKGDYAQALKLARPLAPKEDPAGMYVLGKLYEEGQGIKRDDYTAVKWLAAASHKANYAPAEYALARMYIDGRGVGKSPAKAKEWLTAAAAQGHGESQRLLAELGGKSPPVAAAAPAPLPAAAPVPSSAPAAAAPAPQPAAASPAPAPAPAAISPAPVAAPAKAAEPMASAAKPAPAEAPKTAMLARPAPPADTPSSAAPAPIAPIAPVVPPAPPATTSAPAAPTRAGPPFSPYSAAATKAAATILEAAFKRNAGASPQAARAQLEDPLLTAAMRYWEAEAAGQRKSMEEVRAVIQANAPAAIGAARGMRAGSRAGDLATAALLTEVTQGGASAGAQACDAYVAAAGARGPDHAPAQYHAALCTAQKNPKQSLEWLHAAAFVGHAGALETLGRACMEGAEKDWGCAAHYFELAAGRGRASSMALYGWVLSNQPGATGQDFSDAIAWYRKGAASGDLFAQNNLGEMYERGRGAYKDDKLARDWYGRAAEAGFGPGQFNYARMLLAGTGGPADRAAAVQWLQKAERNGVAPAKAALRQIAAAGK